MPNLEHPNIELDISVEHSFQRLVAEEAYQTLKLASIEHTMELDSKTFVACQITERCDVVASGDEEIALRLLSLPVLSVEPMGDANVLTGARPSEKYLAIELQHGSVDGAIDVAEDEDY